MDPVKENTKFAQAYELRFPLLCDTDYTVAAAFGVARPMVGVAKRSTFLIDPDGTVRKVWLGIRAKGHAAEVLAVARRSGRRSAGPGSDRAAARGRDVSRARAPRPTKEGDHAPRARFAGRQGRAV